MLQKNLKLVGLAVALAIVGISDSWTVQAQEGVTLDPGTVVTEDANQQSLLAEALAAMIQGGYHPKDFDFEKAVFDSLGRAVFLPVLAAEEVQRQISEFLQAERRFLLTGLLYTLQPFEFQGKRYDRGLHPIVLENQQATASTPKNSTETKGPELFDGDTFNCNVEGACVIFKVEGGGVPRGGSSPGPGGGGVPPGCAFAAGLGVGLRAGGLVGWALAAVLVGLGLGCAG